MAVPLFALALAAVGSCGANGWLVWVGFWVFILHVVVIMTVESVSQHREGPPTARPHRRTWRFLP